MTLPLTTIFFPKWKKQVKGSDTSIILKKTKDILVDNKRYNKYLIKHTDTTQMPTYKIPTISSYPIFRNHSQVTIFPKQYTTVNEIKGKKIPKLKLPYSLIIPNKTKLKAYSERSTMIRNFSTLSIETCRSDRNYLLYELIPKYADCPLIYDESEIFNRRVKYNKMIYNKIEYIKENKVENHTIELNTSFNKGTRYEMHLTIYSMKIEFTNLTDQSKSPLVLNIPFPYLFLFYYKGIDFFQYLLMNLIRFTSNSYDAIEFNDEDLSQIIQNSTEDFENYLLGKDNTSRGLLDKIKYRRMLNKRKINFQGKIAPYDQPKIIDTKSPKAQVKDFTLSNYHVYNFLWNTPKYAYSVDISLPMINLYIPNLSKNMIKPFDDELFLYIYENNFLNWDFYIMNYLFSLKYFKSFIDLSLAKHKKKPSLLPLNTTDNTKEVQLVYLSTVKTKQYSEEDNGMFFFTTNEVNENFINTFHSHSIKIDYDLLNPYKRFDFEFNFKQMLLLNKISQYENLECFLKKIVKTESDSGELYIDYTMFDNFNNSYFDGKVLNSLRRSYKEMGNKSPQMTTIDPSSPEKCKEMTISINYPWIEKAEFDLCKEIYKDLDKKSVPCELISDLSHYPVKEWPKILLENKDRMNNIERPISPISTIMKKSTGKIPKSFVFSGNLGLLKEKKIKTVRTTKIAFLSIKKCL